MANSPSDLSDLADALLITIISFLPICIAARTSVLCRHFRHLWEASPSLALISYDLPSPRWAQSKNFIAMAERAVLHRNPFLPLQSLCLELSRCGVQDAMAIVSSLLAKAHSLDLRHLTIQHLWLSDFLPILSIVFTINSLRCLSLHHLSLSGRSQELNFPAGNNLTNLRSLSLELIYIDLANLNKCLFELCSLEDLYLRTCWTPRVSLSSQTIRKLKLIINRDIMGSLSLLESLHLEIKYSLGKLSHIHANVPSLKKIVIKLCAISVVVGLLNCISHVEELSLHLESEDEKNLITILLESIKDVPEFPKLEHMDLTLNFQEHNLEAVSTMLHNCPALKSLKLVHEVPNFTGSSRGGRKRIDRKTRPPRNADDNCHYAYFKNLHLEENRKEVIKFVTRTLHDPEIGSVYLSPSFGFCLISVLKSDIFCGNEQ
ncbi:F-box/LRR-repeat protein [Carex littledalei]|uniref:F-box/LRR-repeat protein n=1 Tax=Carex littledalei TaxID=544730 RepID=A0A833V1F2_9POAL|nr:F-box/LRR-repeat protein [Carex littledalei]